MESLVDVNVACNWNHIGGCEPAQAVQTRITHEDVFVKPDLDEIILKDHAVLLSSPAESDAPCELQLHLQRPAFKIESLTLVCTAPKLELFVGPLKEYAKTDYGAIVEDGGDGEPFSYRYDIEIEKSGIVDLTLKLLTSSDEICVFVLLLQIAPNPNGITTRSINLDNVQKLLNSSAQKLSPNAEKCMLMMQNQSQSSSVPPAALLAQMRHLLAAKAHTGGDDHANKNASASAELPPTLDNVLKMHIDRRLQELEERISTRLNALQVEQNAKLDAILRILEQTVAK